MKDKDYSIASLTDDILQSVEQSETLEKQASADKFEPKTKVAQGLMKYAEKLREQAAKGPEISYDDIREFHKKMETGT